MKKKIINSLLVIFLLLGTFTVWYIYPKQINKTFKGVLYQLGSENAKNEKQVEIKLVGKIQKNFFGKKTFKGKFIIDGEEVPNSKANEKELEFSYDNSGNGGLIQYSEAVEQGYTHLFTFGTLYINDDYTKLTITKHEQKSKTASSWNGKSGIMISAPAKNRTEALNISNELMINTLLEPLN